jgi:hypothetical protein
LIPITGAELPPPDPADWICDVDLSSLVADPHAGPWTAASPWDRPTTWRELIAHRNAYRGRHGVPTRF